MRLARLAGRSSRAARAAWVRVPGSAGRRARSTSAVAVKANSTEAKAKLTGALAGVGDRSPHRFLEAMIQVAQRSGRVSCLTGEARTSGITAV